VPSKAELRALQNLISEKTVSELSEEINYSRSYTSEVVSELEKKGLIETRKEGRHRLVSISESKATELYQKLVQSHGHIGWTELLSGKAVEILYYLEEPKSVSEVAKKTDNYRTTVHRVMDRFLERGIVQKRDSQYRLNEEFLILNDFAKEYFHQAHRGIISSSLLSDSSYETEAETRLHDLGGYRKESYDIIWENPRSFLLSADENLSIDSPEFHPTGPERFQEYGIELVPTNKRYYFYDEDIDDISPQELVCHTLLIDDGTRYRTYCLLLIEKEGIHEEVQEGSEKYGIEKLANSLIRYLKGEEVKGMPDREELESTARKYEVKI
jgi:DNA-binding MarR family transcriptional regulator